MEYGDRPRAWERRNQRHVRPTAEWSYGGLYHEWDDTDPWEPLYDEAWGPLGPHTYADQKRQCAEDPTLEAVLVRLGACQQVAHNVWSNAWRDRHQRELRDARRWLIDHGMA